MNALSADDRLLITSTKQSVDSANSFSTLLLCLHCTWLDIIIVRLFSLDELASALQSDQSYHATVGFTETSLKAVDQLQGMTFDHVMSRCYTGSSRTLTTEKQSWEFEDARNSSTQRNRGWGSSMAVAILKATSTVTLEGTVFMHDTSSGKRQIHEADHQAEERLYAVLKKGSE